MRDNSNYHARWPAAATGRCHPGRAARGARLIYGQPQFSQGCTDLLAETRSGAPHSDDESGLGPTAIGILPQLYGCDDILAGPCIPNAGLAGNQHHVGHAYGVRIHPGDSRRTIYDDPVLFIDCRPYPPDQCPSLHAFNRKIQTRLGTQGMIGSLTGSLGLGRVRRVSVVT